MKGLSRAVFTAVIHSNTNGRCNLSGNACSLKEIIPELKEALSVLMLCPPVFKFTAGSSTLLGCPRCTVIYRSDCRYLPYSIHFSEFMPFSSQENGQNMKILEVHHFCTTQKWLPTVNRCTKHYTERASLQQLTSLPMQ